MKTPMQRSTARSASEIRPRSVRTVVEAEEAALEHVVAVAVEGTANLDEATEETIADLVSQMPITRIVVAHRPALIRRADRIFVVKDRQIREASSAKRVSAAIVSANGAPATPIGIQRELEAACCSFC
jgi:ABC-type lipoprotein export system ATPase subunit